MATTSNRDELNRSVEQCLICWEDFDFGAIMHCRHEACSPHAMHMRCIKRFGGPELRCPDCMEPTVACDPIFGGTGVLLVSLLTREQLHSHQRSTKSTTGIEEEVHHAIDCL